jgi:glycosyltransferase involved in cell wall biosynthesis
MADIIFVSLENWDSVWRRNQFVCAELSGGGFGTKILFVGLSRNVSNDLRRGRISCLFQRGTYAAAGFPDIIITNPLKLFPDSIGLGRKINEWIFRLHVRKVAKSIGMDRPVLWLNPHNAGHMAGRMGESAVIYDITDDWTSFDQPAAVMARTKKQDEELARKADAVIVCSKKLYEMKKGMARRLHLIENGVHAEHYADVLKEGPVPAGAEKWEKPVFGYTGTVHPERVDVGLVESVARKLERGSMVFVGPNHLSTADRARLEATGRVQFVGPVAYADLPQYMRAIDVCIVPHRMTEFTESLNPIKLWEYLAVGKPIVSTDVAGFRDYADLVRIARTADEFLAAMWAAESEGLTLASARRDVARQHSWASRVDQIVAVIDECLGRAGQEEGAHKADEVCVG